MNKTLIALLAFMGSALVSVQAGENGMDSLVCETVLDMSGSGRSWHMERFCSHHRIPNDLWRSLKCMDDRCNVVQDERTGDKFTYGELPDRPIGHGYLHDHQ